MKKTRYTEEQIAFALKQAETGTRVREVCRKMGISEVIGCPHIHVLLRREGWLINHKKTHRIYCLEGLNLRRKRPRRHISAAHRQQRPALTHIDQCWSMDFVSDGLFNGRRFRALTVVDDFSREWLT